MGADFIVLTDARKAACYVSVVFMKKCAQLVIQLQQTMNNNQLVTSLFELHLQFAGRAMNKKSAGQYTDDHHDHKLKKTTLPPGSRAA